MIVRLLVVVLTLVGTVPIRICTCGAAHHFNDGSSGELPPGLGADPAHDHHDEDCHAVKPRPLMSVGLCCGAVDLPVGDVLVEPIAEPPMPVPARGHAIRDVHPPPALPLFLSYTVLRN